MLCKVIKASQVRPSDSVCLLVPCAMPGENTASAQPADPFCDFAHRAELVVQAEARAQEILAGAELERTRILAEAERERAGLLKEAELEAAALAEQARKDGYDAGYLEGLAQGKREAGQLRQEAEQLLEETWRLRREAILRVEPQVVELAVSAAERLLGRQLSLAPETIVSIVGQALKFVADYGEILVRVHPEDIQYCRTFQSELQAALRENAKLDLIADGSLERGSCRVETGGACIECLLGERLVELKKALSGVAGHD